VAAIKDGAFDYLPKNFSVDQLTLVVEGAARPWPTCSSS
jgi:DNA-binding NtrC family response regulator